MTFYLKQLKKRDRVELGREGNLVYKGHKGGGGGGKRDN